MINYRNYGAVDGELFPIGEQYPQSKVDLILRKLTYLATHNGDDTRLPYMYRSFISFSYGGRHIEDFNLIATVSGDRMERLGYSSFNDIVTNYDSLEGLQYWGTHFKTNSFDFVLATDGIDLKQLEDFLHWFIPGEARELVLAEHPNRAQMARVSEPPQLSLLPFETTSAFKVSEVNLPVKTTLYKGTISLKLIMDLPHWYARDNILGTKEDDRYIDMWTDANGNLVDIFASEDALKILYEDGIPLGTMILDNMILGNGAYANVEDNVESCVWSIPEDEIIWALGVPSGEGARINGVLTLAEYEARSLEAVITDAIEPAVGHQLTTEVPRPLIYNMPPDFVPDSRECLPGEYIGIIAGAIISADGKGVKELLRNEYVYFFYAGTAPAPATLTFTLLPELSLTNNYILTPRNSHNVSGNKYNTITVGSLHTLTLHFTTPNILTSYNKAIEIIKDSVKTSNNNWESIREKLRDRVRHAGAREWAIKVIDYGEKKNINDKNALMTCMTYFLKESISGNVSDAELVEKVYPMTCTFNSETGEAIGYFKYRKITDDIPDSEGAWKTYGQFLTTSVTEDIGDMIRSNYLVIRDRNYATDNGKIVRYNELHKDYSHYIVHDFNVPLKNFLITYKNMYL